MLWTFLNPKDSAGSYKLRVTSPQFEEYVKDIEVKSGGIVDLRLRYGKALT